MPCILL
jgi:omega-amidase